MKCIGMIKISVNLNLQGVRRSFIRFHEEIGKNGKWTSYWFRNTRATFCGRRIVAH